MKSMQRKQELIKLILKLNNENTGRIYYLINKGCLDNTINEIDDNITEATKCYFNKKGYLTGNEQFINILSNFIYYTDSLLAPLTHKNMHIEFMLENQIPEFLLCKRYWGDNNNIAYFTYNIKYTIIYNFYDNIKFIYEFIDSKFWQKLKITKNMNIKNEKDLNILMNFLLKIIWCNINDNSTGFLFDNYNSKLKRLYKKNNNYQRATIFSKVREQYIIQYEMMFYNYLKKNRFVNKLLINKFYLV